MAQGDHLHSKPGGIGSSSGTTRSLPARQLQCPWRRRHRGGLVCVGTGQAGEELLDTAHWRGWPEGLWGLAGGGGGGGSQGGSRGGRGSRDGEEAGCGPRRVVHMRGYLVPQHLQLGQWGEVRT
jgi:hypothetical protein